MKHTRLLALITFLIIYGSLYPFNFSPAKPDALVKLFSKMGLVTSAGDMLGNVVLFAPMGMIAMLSCAPRWKLLRAAVGTIIIGLSVALGLQVLQIYLPTRDATLADVVWNLLGLSIGALAGGFMAECTAGLNRPPSVKALPLCLLIGLVAIEWLPFVPSLDLQLVKVNLKLLWSTPVTLTASLWQGIAVAMIAGYLLSNLFDLQRSTLWLYPLLTLISVGKLFIEDISMHPSGPIGLALGGLVWGIVRQVPVAQRHNAVWLILIVCYTASALQPYQLRDEAPVISWLPFATMLEGSMLDNVRSLTGNLIFYVGILYAGAMASGRIASATLSLSLWVLVTELMQSLIKTRGADITAPLLVLLLGQTLSIFQPVDEGRVKGIASAILIDHPLQPAGLTKWLLQAGMATSILMLSLTALLSQPGVPYNVRELFRNDASLFSLFTFSMALLWAGGGSVWLGTRLARARWPGLQLLPLTLIVSLVSLAWLWAGVTTESIEDISGSANRFWFVTQQEIWGTIWRDAFLSIGSPELIGMIEHFVRYSALYAPLPIFLGILIALRQWRSQGTERATGLAQLLLGGGALLWLCKAIAFDWTSTDNLNELIAHDGDWGWGGGGFLYLLLVVICINGLILAEAASAGINHVGLALLLSLTALPLGWWLLNQGLEQTVQKYGLVYSGTQFLLGEDRLHTLTRNFLLVRWCTVQASAVLILATGIWLGLNASRKNLVRTHLRHHSYSSQENANS